MAKTDPVNISDPPGLSDPKLGDDYIRTLARASIELVNKDHFIGVATNGAYDEDDAGEHTKITFHAPLADNPAGKTINSDETATDAHEGYLYLKDVANSDEDDVAELHFQDENGNHIQMSAEGYSYLEKPLIPNNTAFKAYNSSKDGFVQLYKCNTSGEFEFMVKAKLLADTTAIASSTLAFTSGSTEIVATNIITGVSSGYTATVKSIILSSGSWAGGDAAGSMQLNNVTGSFTNGEELSVGASAEIATAGTYTAGTADNIATEGYVDTKEALIASQATAGLFGAWTDKDSDNSTLVKTVSYTTQCDGFITAYADNGGTVVHIETPIGTMRTGGIGGQSYAGWWGGVCCPVRKGDTWKVVGADHIYWLPFGTGVCDK